MDLDSLYQELLALYSGGKLTLTYYCAEGIFDGLMTILNTDSLEMTGGQPQKKEGLVTFSGSASPSCFGAGGTLTFAVRVEEERAVGEISLSFDGEYTLRDFFPASTALSESPFHNFKLRSPVFCTSFEEEAAGLAISCNTRPDFSDEAWDAYQIFDERLMPTTGFYFQDGFGRAIVNLDFAVNCSFSNGMVLEEASFPVLSVTLAVRMASEEFDEEPKLYPLLLIHLQEDDLFQQGLTLQVPVLDEAKYVQYAAYFTPVLSAGNVVNFIGRLTGADVAELLPKDTFLTSFGLKYIGVQTENDLSKLGDAKQMELVFDLERPWQTPFSCLTLENFQVGFTASWWDAESKNALVSADFLVRASLKLKSHTITGKIKGYLPRMSFEGALELYEDEMSLGALSEDLDAKLPEKWTGKNPVASILVSANLENRILYLSAQAEDVLSIDIGSTVFKLETISAHITVTPEKTSFGIEGGASFGSGDANFLMLLHADYDDGWSFGGSLGRGEVNIGKLLKQMFGIESEASEDILSVALTEFEFFYSVKDSRFYLYAVMEAGWKLPMGFMLETGGKLKLSQKEKDALAVSAAVYLGIGDFLCLVQADDLSGKEPKYLFRVQFGKVYAQAVYEKNQYEENVLTISLGGVTLGEIVETLVRLINPNAKTHLESPWDVLNRIDLSAFSLEINMDRKTAIFWVDIKKSLAGLIELDKIGLKYEDGHINYQMTGRMLGKDYKDDSPVSWDAQTGTPPTPSAQKTKLYYLGLGQHIDVDVSAATIKEVLKNISETLKPGEPSLAYSEEVGFLFVTDFSIADLFRLRAAFVDPKLYGVQITVDVSEKSPAAVLNGLELELLYRKISESVGMFSCTLTVPKKFSTIQLGAVTIHIGRIYVEIYTNGSFLIDLGFPHNEDFSQSFGIEFGIFTGRGGIYFGVLKGDAVKNVPETDKGAFTPVVLIGLGVSIGLGRSFDAGIVKGSVSLTLLAILEGVFAVYRPKQIADGEEQEEEFYYRVSAKAGVCGTLFLSVDFKIISISASAKVQAVCALTLESYRDTEVSLALALEVSASIKILFIRIHFSFSFHRTVNFKLASGGTAPWDAVLKQDKRERLVNTARFEPVELEAKTIYVNITPVISMYNPLEETKRYCIAFLATVGEDDFKQLTDLFLQWVLSNEEGDGFCGRDYVLALDASPADDITWETVEQLFEQNLTVHVGLTAAGTQDEEEAGAVSFPMLPYLTLKPGNEIIDFGQNPVDEAYYKKLSDYLALLNADPCKEEGTQEVSDTNDSLPACAAVALDYFKMLLSAIMDKLKELYEEISVTGISMSDMMEAYQPDAAEFLSANPDLEIQKAVISNRLHVLSETDTLESLEALDKASIWDNLSEKNSILRLGTELAIDFTFDNKGELSPKQAAAMLYSRYSSRDIIYLKQVDKVQSCGVTSEWECEMPYSRTLDLGLDKPYTALAGDTLIRIARMLAVLEDDYQDEDWEKFYRSFLNDNNLTEGDTSPLSAYKVKCNTILKDDRTLAKLFRRVYPDFAGKPETFGLWKSALFEPLQEISLGSVEESEKTIRQLMELYGAGELADSLTSEKLEEKDGQTLHIPNPKQIPTDTLGERIGAAAQEIGGMLSRFFLQGLRVPSGSGDGVVPLYELLKQQIPLKTGQGLPVSLSGDPACAWIVTDTREQSFSPEQIEAMMPSGELPERALPHLLPVCEEQESCTTLFDFRILDGTVTAASLSEAFRKDLQEIGEGDELRLFADGNETTDFRWGVVMDFTVQRAGADSYLVFGVAAGDRKRLLLMAGCAADSLKITFAPSKLSSNQSQLVSVPTDSCVLVKANLSVQTHMGFYGAASGDGGEEAYTYSAKITQTGQFLKLLWECSVIGGGFFLHCKDIPENIFSEDGRGTLCICAAYSELAAVRTVADSILISGKYKELMFKNGAKHVYTPVSPVGSVRLLTQVDGNGTTEELFQIMSYTAQVNGQSVESAPIFPQNGADGMEYLFTVPLYRLVDKDNCYSAVGKTLSLEIGLRDILGNYAKLGDTEATGEYNDELISVCEYPRTKVSYELFDDEDKKPSLRIRLEYVSAQETKGTQQEQSLARTAMQQLNCADVTLRITCTAQKDTEWKLTGADEDGGLSELRAYLAELTSALSGEGSEVKDVEFVFTLEMDKLPGDIFALGVTCEIVRDGCESACERVCRAEAAVPANESMEDSVRFGEVLLASCGTGLYGVRESFLQKLDVKAYFYEKKSTPRFYAMAPFANQLISRRISSQGLDGTETERIYSGCDLNAWVKRFFEDVECLLDGENVCMAGEVCPDYLDELVEGKKLLAEKTSSRVVPLCEELTGTDAENEEAQETFKDYYLAKLTNVYALDVAAAYQADFPVGSGYRLEISLKESSLFLPQKIAGQEQENSDGVRQFFLLSCNAEHKTTENALHFFVQDIEYNIESGIGEYNSSDWVRLREVYTPAGSELQADFGIPHPIALCPSAPSVLGQEAEASEEIARWDYTVTLSCLAYEQYTLYLRIKIGEETAASDAETGKDMFEVLADYDEERDSIFQHLKDNDLSSAYQKMARTAKALASASVPERLLSDSSEKEINLKLTFKKGEALSVQAEEIGSVLDSLGARLGEVNVLSGGEIGETVKFAVSIENLPLESCQAVRPYARIVQNENLFQDDTLQVRDEFIFRTEETAGQMFYASVIYPEAFSQKSKDLSSAIHEIWDALSLSKTDVQMQADLEVSYLYQMTGLVGDLEMSCPVTFLPQASDETKAVNDIEEWFDDKSFVLSEGRLCLRALLRAKGDGRILGQLVIQVEWTSEK